MKLQNSQQLSQAPVRWFESEADAVDRYLKVSGLNGCVAADVPEARSGVRERDGRYRLAADPKTHRIVGARIEDFFKAARSPYRLGAGSKDPMVGVLRIWFPTTRTRFFSKVLAIMLTWKTPKSLGIY